MATGLAVPAGQAAIEDPLQTPSDDRAETEAEAEGGEEVAELSGALAAIGITVDDVPDPEPEMDPDEGIEFPASYTGNSAKEEQCLGFVEAFNRQFKSLYSHRKPLLLTARNECGVEKFVSTTVRPTKLAYGDLYPFHGAAAFVADFLHYEFLSDPCAAPEVLPSPTTVMRRQRANCFDFGVVLCSLLEGVGYDAYCVNGYATKEVTLLEQNRLESLLEAPRPKAAEAAVETKPNKYRIDLRDKLKSNFTAQQAEKQRLRKEQEAREAAAVAEKERLEVLRPADEPLIGLRVHCWVMVRAGKRGVPETFFIEPTTGHALSTLDENYLGIETVWNSRNLWVNMQKCHRGLVDLRYDLSDTSLWEFVFPDSATSGTEVRLQGASAPADGAADTAFDVPPSWVNKLSLEVQDFETRCPNGKKVILHETSRTEVFAPYLRDDGLVRRTTEYEEKELETPLRTLDTFDNRADRLIRRSTELATSKVEDMFLPGHKHRIRLSSLLPGDPVQRDMTFYHDARADGLIRRLDTSVEMVETFTNREDNLIERHSVFPGGRVFSRSPSAQPPVVVSIDSSTRPIVCAREVYARNPSRAADQDPHTIVYSATNIAVTYHIDVARVTATTRDFEKPSTVSARGPKPITSAMVDCYEANPNRVPLRDFELQEIFLALGKKEQRCRRAVLDALEETESMLQLFEEQNASLKLVVSFYDTVRNQDAELKRQQMEEKEREDKRQREEREKDYLSPFLSQIPEPDAMTTEKAAWLREACLGDLKDRLLEQAHRIQEWHERERVLLQDKQAWYKENQQRLKAEEEEDYIQYCKDAVFRVRLLEQRLERHKEMAPSKYVELDRKMQTDPRLSPFLPEDL